jgi:hypothetical protein
MSRLGPLHSAFTAAGMRQTVWFATTLVTRLKREAYWVRGADLKVPEFSDSTADDFVVGDLRDQRVCREVIDRPFSEVYQLAADMGGAGYIFTGENDADVIHNSATINLKVGLRLSRAQSKGPEQPELRGGLRVSRQSGKRVWLGEAVQRTSLPGIQPKQGHALPHCTLSQHFRPRGYLAQRPREGSSSDVPQGGRRRTDAVFPLHRRMPRGRSPAMAKMVIAISGKTLDLVHVPGPTGVRGRNSDNHRIGEKLGWRPTKWRE